MNRGIGLPGRGAWGGLRNLKVTQFVSLPDTQARGQAQASVCPQEHGCRIPTPPFLLHSCCGSCCLPVLSPELLSPLSGCCQGVGHTQCGPTGMPLPQLCAPSQGSAPSPIDNRCQLMPLTTPDHLSPMSYRCLQSRSLLLMSLSRGHIGDMVT